jgi:hypothetical protein
MKIGFNEATLIAGSWYDMGRAKAAAEKPKERAYYVHLDHGRPTWVRVDMPPEARVNVLRDLADAMGFDLVAKPKRRRRA